MKKYFPLFCLLTSSVFANDFTGTYQCEGNDGSEGTYQGEVVMKKIPEFSKDNYASYDFVLKVPGFGDYHGFASANGLDVAIYFALDGRHWRRLVTASRAAQGGPTSRPAGPTPHPIFVKCFIGFCS